MVRRVIRQGFWVTIILTVPAMVLFPYTPDLLGILDQPPQILPHADAYMSTLMWSLMPSIGFAVVRNFISSLNRPSPALWVMLAGVPLNGALDYALIFGNFGFSRMELVGAGIATSAINWLMFLSLLGIAVFRKPFSAGSGARTGSSSARYSVSGCRLRG
jgi:multidrug resistance protein, MATE family